MIVAREQVLRKAKSRVRSAKKELGKGVPCNALTADRWLKSNLMCTVKFAAQSESAAKNRSKKGKEKECRPQGSEKPLAHVAKGNCRRKTAVRMAKRKSADQQGSEKPLAHVAKGNW